MGGAGVTYLAKELDHGGQPTGPDLAIKVLLAHRDHGPYLKRLATEAGILRELDHPNIVQCLGFVHRAGHTPYLVVLKPGLPVKPFTLFVNKATIASECTDRSPRARRKRAWREASPSRSPSA